ncbi:MAG: hypothetical protein ACXWN0_10615 [Isosphaeraceae bacterium]
MTCGLGGLTYLAGTVNGWSFPGATGQASSGPFTCSPFHLEFTARDPGTGSPQGTAYVDE